MPPTFVPQRITLRYATDALGRNGPVFWTTLALFAAWGALQFPWAIPGGPFASLSAWVRYSLGLLGEVAVMVAAVVLKNWVIRRNGHARVRERPVWAVVIEQVKFVVPCVVIVLLGLVVWLVPALILFSPDDVPMFLGQGVTVLVLSPLLLPFVFIGEVAVFGVTVKTREALALSRGLMRANLPWAIGAYGLNYALVYFLPEDTITQQALTLVTVVFAPVFLVLWTTAFGDSLSRPRADSADGPAASPGPASAP